ncbi:L-aspartate oxidase [Saccharopolyspora kobensis]|uniref:L-aspartate oxidase n=3 Tax=Saccharopolyspora kobensis TaxID=146035 RepID=A0A1H6C1F7_9PSEU|nr:L-aspartate oxidase [Saccharopolyspora kobensis]SEG66781.1 L-aspartate oxidase [Saccharopolyspora kobensis]SFC23999.1 L-aspartate oxidase [Saccharopolyspora kobensis]
MSWEAGADLLVVGTGVAGMTAALRARELGLRVLVVSKDSVDAGNTSWAQGGIAVVRPDELDPGDSLAKHVEDTLTAGVGLCSRPAVREILAGGAAAIDRLRSAGARFDVGTGGELARTREGGHSAFRVIHAGGDATGAEVQRALADAVRGGGIPVLEQHCVVELLRGEDGSIAGALAMDGESRPGVLRAPAVLLATGGLGQLYAATTNPEVSTADGVALALRAGATVADLEFVQFHPTVLYTPGGPRGRRPLITEAVRGEGAVLVDVRGRRVMAGEHPLEDLAPRDVVSAAINRRAAETGSEHVFLDATGIGAGFAARFPTVHAACLAAGIDPVREPIPVASAAHYSCGGVMSSVDGRTSVSGLYAAGEVACTGLHGANRLASNSLLEGLVVGARAAEAVAKDLCCGLLTRKPVGEVSPPALAVVDRELLQTVMSRHAGIGRSEEGLATATRALDGAAIVRPLRTREAVEDASMLMTAQALLAAARQRAESRGCHRRSDFPDTDDLRWRRSTVFRLDASGWLIHTTAGIARTAA